MIQEALTAITFSALVALAFFPARPLHLTPGFRVVDGDTLAIGARRIRLLGFDAPETWRPKCEAERLLGAMATLRMRMMVTTRGARLEKAGARDFYGRDLARLTVGQEDAAAIMVREGLARPYRGGRRKGWCGG